MPRLKGLPRQKFKKMKSAMWDKIRIEDAWNILGDFKCKGKIYTKVDGRFYSYPDGNQSIMKRVLSDTKLTGACYGIEGG